MKIFHLCLALLAVLCVFSVAEAKKRKKQKSLGHRPLNMEPYLYCLSCLAVGREILRKVRDNRSEVNIYDALTNICDPRNYMVYHMSPPDLSKGCTAFLNGNEEVIVDVILNTKNMTLIGERLCYNETDACDGVDINNPPEVKDEYEMNGVVYTRNGAEKKNNTNTTESNEQSASENQEKAQVIDEDVVTTEELSNNPEISVEVVDNAENKSEEIKTPQEEQNNNNREDHSEEVRQRKERKLEPPVKSLDLEELSSTGKVLDLEL